MRGFIAYVALMAPIALLDVGILQGLVLMGSHYLLANLMSFTIVNALFYVLSRRLIFRDAGQGSAGEFVVFAAIGVVAIAIQSLAMWLTVEQAHLHHLIGKVGAMGITVVWTFAARRWLFRRFRQSVMG